MKTAFVFLMIWLSNGAASASTPQMTDFLSCSNSRAEIFRLYLSETQPGRTKSPSELQKVIERIHQLMTHNFSQIKAKKLAESEADPLLHLSRLEMRSQIEPDYDVINAQLDTALDEARQLATELQLPCLATPPSTRNPGSGNVHVAALKTMATSYQSCQVLNLPPVTAAVEEVQGVIRYNQIDEAGWGRKYTNLPLLKQTHYYHRGQTYGGACANQDQAPLVYDYGGVPVIANQSTELDMFRNSGGGPALGIDCSAFVSTANAVAGNLYRRESTNHPAYTRYVSRDFINPRSSGWNCYDSLLIEPSSTLQSGDIAAVQGHIVIVDQVGSDPFGLSNLNAFWQCDSLKFQNFDFSVIQSSHTKEHLGINRAVARDFLATSEKMAALFVGYGKAVCKTKFDGQVRNPMTGSYGMIRHKSESSCRAPAIKLKNEECVQACAGN